MPRLPRNAKIEWHVNSRISSHKVEDDNYEDDGKCLPLYHYLSFNTF